MCGQESSEDSLVERLSPVEIEVLKRFFEDSWTKRKRKKMFTVVGVGVGVGCLLAFVAVVVFFQISKGLKKGHRGSMGDGGDGNAGSL